MDVFERQPAGKGAGESAISVTRGVQYPIVDDPVPLQVSGCSPGSRVSVEALVEIDGAVFRAEGVYRVSDAGGLDTATASSEAGTYQGIDPYGLWWSGEQIGAATTAPPGPAPVPCRIHVSNGAASTVVRFDRSWLPAGATVTPVSERGVWGVYARPAGVGPFPGAVAFGGSGGGLGPAAMWAPLLAAHGIATLAVGYFAGPGLPPTLSNIPIETVQDAARWLLDRDEIRGERVGLITASRGSELALWAAALLDIVGPTVAYSPSGISWAGLDRSGPVDGPAWTFRGRPLPYVPPSAGRSRPPTGKGPIALVDWFTPVLNDPALYEGAEIPVENITAPVLLVSGESDAMWPSTALAVLIERRAAAHRSTFPLRHLRYPGAGHLVSRPPGIPTPPASRHPVTGQVYDFGGTQKGTAHAQVGSWPQVIAWLGGHSGGDDPVNPLT
jgi:dienelactone hydrolase